MLKIRATGLKTFVADLLKKSGCLEYEASVVAQHLVNANLTGHDSHGIGCLPFYIESIKNGKLIPNVELEIIKDVSSILVVQGGRGFGHKMAAESTELAIKKTKENDGLTMFSFQGGFHIGRIGTYAEMCSKNDLASVFFVNVSGHSPLVAPFGGTDARFGTNPFCCGIPAGANTPPVILDMATSKLALGKVREALGSNLMMEDDVLLDEFGNPSADPATMFTNGKYGGSAPKGALLPFGLHKGSGLGIMCELFAGVLTGSGSIQPENPRDFGIKNAMTGFVFDPKKLNTDSSWMQREIDKTIEYIKQSPPAKNVENVLAPGDLERITKENRLKYGIPVSSGNWEKLEETATLLQIRLEEHELFIQ